MEGFCTTSGAYTHERPSGRAALAAAALALEPSPAAQGAAANPKQPPAGTHIPLELMVG